MNLYSQWPFIIHGSSNRPDFHIVYTIVRYNRVITLVNNLRSKKFRCFILNKIGGLPSVAYARRLDRLVDVLLGFELLLYVHLLLVIAGRWLTICTVIGHKLMQTIKAIR